MFIKLLSKVLKNLSTFKKFIKFFFENVCMCVCVKDGVDIAYCTQK